jgi:carboxylesterase type B
MNIVIPRSPSTQLSQCPVLVYVHGGSLLYGGANLPIFDGVNLVSHSLAIDKPIIYVSFNYRVGLGGFLASRAIAGELHDDGHSGCGNFGFTDQKVAFDWVQAYISQLGGDKDNVSAVGESAGGISISNQLLAAHPPVFHRAICMSGLSVSIPAWPMDRHERLFEATCSHFNIDPSDPAVLDKLRRIPEQDLANATPTIQGVPSGTGNPCLDSWFYALDPRTLHEPPSRLKSFMAGDTYHEGVIFHLNILDETYDSVRDVLQGYINDEQCTDRILAEYAIHPDLQQDILLERIEHMCGDAVFKIPNYVLSHTSRGLRERNAMFRYHFDQRSRIKNPLEGTAYHAHELLYLFGNLDNELNEKERGMAREFASAWIRFVHGDPPWDGDGWMVWGPDARHRVKSEEEDEPVRAYSRIKRILGLGEGEVWTRWLSGVDALVNKRWMVGRVG